jgi:hypothetical protein
VLEAQFTFHFIKNNGADKPRDVLKEQGGGRHAPINALYRKYALFTHDDHDQLIALNMF